MRNASPFQRTETTSLEEDDDVSMSQDEFTNDEYEAQSSISDESRPDDLLDLLIHNQRQQSFHVSNTAGLVHWLKNDPITSRYLIPIEGEYLGDEFNAACTDRWPPWTDLDEPEYRDGESLMCISRARAAYNFLRHRHGDFAKSFREHLSHDPDFLRDSLQMYMLLHQRWIFTKAAMQEAYGKLEDRFVWVGTCPRVLCNRQVMLPHGFHAEPGRSRMSAYCPLCQEVYDTNCPLDGAFYGPFWAPFFTLVYLKNLHKEGKLMDCPLRRNWDARAPVERYEPRIFGFRVI